MLTFEELSGYAPKMTYLGKCENDADGRSTEFWEDLYQLFKARMIEEMKEIK